MNVYIVNCFDTYEHRVDLLYKFFSSRGDNVKVLSSNFRHIEKIKRTDNKDGYKFFETEPYNKNLSLQRILSHVHLSKSIFKYVRKNISDIDLLWVLIPPNSFVKDASKIKREYPQVKLIFDVIDMWPETMPIGKLKKTFPARIWGNFRDKNIKYADTVVTECDLYQEKLCKYVPREKMQTLYLARELKEFVSNPNPPKDMISLCYLGSINNIIDIPKIGEIINEYKKQKPVVLHIIGDGEKKQELINEAQRNGAKVIDHGKVYDQKKKQEIFDQCHFGLNIYKDNVYIGLTMKSIDYLEAGLPIINNIKGDTFKLVDNFRCGINIGNNEEFLYNRENARYIFESYFSIGVFNTRVSRILKND